MTTTTTTKSDLKNKKKKSPEISCILMCPGPPGVLSRVILHIQIGAKSHLTVIHQSVD